MNADGLSRLYAELDTWERIALSTAAYARRDQVEIDRLNHFA